MFILHDSNIHIRNKIEKRDNNNNKFNTNIDNNNNNIYP